MDSKKSKLFLILGGIFLANALLAEFIGGKNFFGRKSRLVWSQLAYTYLATTSHLILLLAYCCGPVVFVLTDIINEYFGKKGVRFLSYFAVGLISYAFVMIYFSIGLQPADFYIASQAQNGIPDHEPCF